MQTARLQAEQRAMQVEISLAEGIMASCEQEAMAQAEQANVAQRRANDIESRLKEKLKQLARADHERDELCTLLADFKTKSATLQKALDVRALLVTNHCQPS